MHVNHSAHTLATPVSPENDLEDLLDEHDTQVLIEALSQLRQTKQQALSLLLAEGLRPGGREFEPRDFGIPQIDRLLKRLGAEPFAETTPSEEQ